MTLERWFRLAADLDLPISMQTQTAAIVATRGAGGTLGPIDRLERMGQEPQHAALAWSCRLPVVDPGGRGGLVVLQAKGDVMARETSVLKGKLFDVKPRRTKDGTLIRFTIDVPLQGARADFTQAVEQLGADIKMSMEYLEPAQLPLGQE